MNYPFGHSSLPNPPSLISLPPATIDETGWDILPALHGDQQCDLSLAKLACLTSASKSDVDRWLADLEERALSTGAAHRSTGELVAVLTLGGRELLDRYLAAASGFQVAAYH